MEIKCVVLYFKKIQILYFLLFLVYIAFIHIYIHCTYKFKIFLNKSLKAHQVCIYLIKNIVEQLN